MEVVFHRNFKKKFKKLPSNIKAQFQKRLDAFLSNPFDTSLNNHTVGRIFPGCQSINITGDYRAIFHVKEEICIFINIGSHSDLYS